MRVTDKYTSYKPKNEVVSRHGTRMAFIEDLMKIILSEDGDRKAEFFIDASEKASVRASVAYLNERFGFNFFVTITKNDNRTQCKLVNRDGLASASGKVDFKLD